MIPETYSWAEIGARLGIDLSDIPDTNPVIEAGLSLFERLSRSEQIAILGLAKYNAWRDGKFTLDAIVGRKHSSEWGTHWYERSLAELGINARDYLAIQNRSLFGMKVERLVEFVRDLDARLGDILGDIGGKQRWSGNILIKLVSEFPDMIGMKNWNCDIWLREDAYPGALIHELLHGRSPGLEPRAYSENRGIEEGVVEKLARMYGPEVLRGTGLEFGKPIAYDNYIDALEEIRKRVNKGEEEFYRLLYSTPLSRRQNVLIDLANDRLWVYDILSQRLEAR
jgi:hypothetical protein